jgi:hypothetical protein
MAEALFNLVAHCRTVISFSDEKDVHLLGQHYRLDLLKVKKF